MGLDEQKHAAVQDAHAAQAGSGAPTAELASSHSHNSRPAQPRVTLQVSMQPERSPSLPAATEDYKDLPEYSLYILSKSNAVRRAALWIIHNSYFDKFILLVILANCIELALYSHKPGFEQTELAQILDIAEYVFLVVFGSELVLKILAMGLVMKSGTYLRNGWNVLDATIVVLGVADAATTGPSYSAVRAVRVLRPLRTITHIKGLKVPVVTLLHALPQLVDVGILCGFALLIFGIVGVQMFAGVMQNRCAAADFTYATLAPSSVSSSSAVYSNVSYLLPLGSNQLCSGYLSTGVTWQVPPGLTSNNSLTWSGSLPGGGFVCPTDPNPAAGAPHGMFCAPFQNPNGGLTSFDNVLWAWLTIFQCITQEGWTDIMYAMWDALSPGTLVYFMLLIIFGSFFLINLALAVLYLQFTKEFSVAPAVSRSASYAAGSSSLKQQLLPEDSNFQLEQQPEERVTADDYDEDVPGGLPGAVRPPPNNTVSQVGFMLDNSPMPPELDEVTDAAGAAADNAAAGYHGNNTLSAAADTQGEEYVTAHVAGTEDYVTAHVMLNGEAATTGATAVDKQMQGSRTITKHESFARASMGFSDDASQQEAQTPSSVWASVRRICHAVAQNGWFGILNLVVILANTAVMATTSYPMSSSWSTISELMNVAFSVYFALELVLKVIAMGPRAYIKDRMNQFDALVVLASVVEIIMMLVPGAGGLSSLSVLRTARLMRVFKLARSWKELNRIITTILRSFSQVMYLSLLVVLFVFIFALMGMQLFGYKFGSCAVPGAQQVCPPGVTKCPDYPDCYVPCDLGSVFSWTAVPGSPYNNQAYCEQFPRNSTYRGNASAAAAADAMSPAGRYQYWAQVGKAQVPDSRFDNIGWAALTVFQIVTTENWNNVMYSGMAATNPAMSLYFIAGIVVGNYILLNLFLAILLENFGAPSAPDGSASRSNRTVSNGSTMAAAAKMAVVFDWMRDLLDSSWIANRLERNRKVHPMADRHSTFGEWEVDDPQLDMSRTFGHQAAAAASFQAPGEASQGFSALKAPPKSSASLFSSFIGGSRPSFITNERTSSATVLKAPVGPAAADLQVHRSNQSAVLLQGNVDLLFARPQAASQGSGGSFSYGNATGHRLAGQAGSRLQQQSGMDGKVNMSSAPSAANNLNSVAYGAGSESMRSGGASGNWEGAVTHRFMLEGYSFGVLGPNNWLRVTLLQTLQHRHFENFILVLILLSSLTLALQMPSLDRDAILYQVLNVMDMVFVVLFALEAAMKGLVKGFLFNGRDSYLQNAWNILDFLIVIIGVVMMAVSLGGGDVRSLSSLRALRTLRALRPLRVASRLEGMKVVVNALFASLPPLGNVCLVCLLFYLIFGIMGVHLLAGMLYSCQDSQGNTYDASYVLPPGQYITRDWCQNATLQVTTSAYHAAINVTIAPYAPDRQWLNNVFNYDNVLQATLTLFSISSTELWINTMYQGIAAIGIDQQPIDGANPWLALFFVVFIVIGGFFVLQLFVATTIEKFAEMQVKQNTRGIMLTARQEEWLTIQRLMADVKLKAQYVTPENRLRRLIFMIAMSETCEFFIMMVIIANVGFLTLTHANMDNNWQTFLSYSNVVFTGIFTMEALLKMIAIGLWNYLKDGWCQFDLFVVAVSIIGVAIDLGTTQNLEFLPLIRVMRVARVFRLIPKAQGLRTLLQTLVFSLPALGNVGSVLFLFFFIYAVVGMNLFGSIKYGNYLNDKVNFSNVGVGLLTLFRMITGESWDGIMQDCFVTTGCVEITEDVLLPPGVTSPTNSSVLGAGTWLDPDDPLLSLIPAGASFNRCSPGMLVAVIYFCTFVLLCGFVLVNFVIGVIIDNMQSSKTRDDMSVSRYHLEQFVKAWSELDPRATHYIPAIDLSTLIQELPPPLGVKNEGGERAKIQSIIMSIDIPVRHTKVHFLETLHALSGRIAGTEEPDSEEQKVHQKMHPYLPVNDPSDPPKYTVAHFYAALYVQAAVRGFLKRHAVMGVGVQTVTLHELPRGTLDDDAEDD